MNDVDKNDLYDEIKQKMEALHASDKNMFEKMIEEFSGDKSGMVGEPKSIEFENGLLDKKALDTFDQILKKLFELVKDAYGKENEYIFNEVALFKKYGNNMVPVYFITMIGSRYLYFKTKVSKLATEVEKNLKSMGPVLQKLKDGRVDFAPDGEDDDFDMVYQQGKYVIGLNNYYYSLDELQLKWNFDVKALKKDVEDYFNGCFGSSE